METQNQKSQGKGQFVPPVNQSNDSKAEDIQTAHVESVASGGVGEGLTDAAAERLMLIVVAAQQKVEQTKLQIATLQAEALSVTQPERDAIRKAKETIGTMETIAAGKTAEINSKIVSLAQVASDEWAKVQGDSQRLSAYRARQLAIIEAQAAEARNKFAGLSFTAQELLSSLMGKKPTANGAANVTPGKKHGKGCKDVNGVPGQGPGWAKPGYTCQLCGAK